MPCFAAGEDAPQKTHKAHGRSRLMATLHEGGGGDAVQRFASEGRFAKLCQQQDDNGHTALMVAARDGQAEVVSQLLKSFALRPNAAKSAPSGGRRKKTGVADGGPVVRILTEQVDRYGQTPLLLAAMFNQPTALRELLGADAAVGAAGYDGRTALHWAALNGSTRMLEALLAAGAEVRRTGRDGKDPLMLAAAAGSAAVVDQLLRSATPENPLETPSILFAHHTRFRARVTAHCGTIQAAPTSRPRMAAGSPR